MSSTTRKQMPASKVCQIFCCCRIACFLGYLGIPSPSKMLKNKEWLPYYMLTLQSARGRADRSLSAEKATLLPRSRQENVLSLSGHRLHFAVPILCPCVVSKAEAGLRGPFGMETLHKWFLEKALLFPNFYSTWINVGFIAPWCYGPLRWRQALWHTVFFVSHLVALHTLPRRIENPATKGLPAKQFSFPEKVCTVIQTLASILISCLAELAPTVNFTVNNTCCSRKLFNHNIKTWTEIPSIQ